jgi:hypothetical protein
MSAPQELSHMEFSTMPKLCTLMIWAVPSIGVSAETVSGLVGVPL